MMTVTKAALRELLADMIRDNRGSAPGDLADALMDTIRRYAPKAFIEERLDVDNSVEDKYTGVAREMILSHAFDVGDWEIHAAYPRLTDDEVQVVSDLIGQASVQVSF